MQFSGEHLLRHVAGSFPKQEEDNSMSLAPSLSFMEKQLMVPAQRERSLTNDEQSQAQVALTVWRDSSNTFKRKAVIDVNK